MSDGMGSSEWQNDGPGRLTRDGVTVEFFRDHRLTLVPWAEAMPQRVDGPGFPMVRNEPRWTAACDCGWHSTAALPTPGQVLRGYADHLDGEELAPGQEWTPFGAASVADALGASIAVDISELDELEQHAFAVGRLNDANHKVTTPDVVRVLISAIERLVGQIGGPS